MSEWNAEPMHLFADLGGEYSTNDEDHRWIVKQCAEQWEKDRARLDSARELLERTVKVDLDNASPCIDTIQEDICTWFAEEGNDAGPVRPADLEE